MSALDPWCRLRVPGVGSSRASSISGDVLYTTRPIPMLRGGVSHDLRAISSRPQPDYFTVSGDDNFSETPSNLDINDRLVAIAAVVIMDAGPALAAQAARFLHAHYAFIQEVILWNNHNQTMNHHLLPYDLATRYVKAPRKYGSYARVLGCLLSRHEICYFQHESLRPTYLDSMFATFLRAALVEACHPRARNHIIVASADADNADFVRRELSFVLPTPMACRGHPCPRQASASLGMSDRTGCTGARVSTFVDWDTGVLAHKDVIKRHMRNLDRMSTGLDSLESRVEVKAIVSDLILAYGLRHPPIVLAHKIQAIGNPDDRGSWSSRIISTGVALAAANLIAPLHRHANGLKAARHTPSDESLIIQGQTNPADARHDDIMLTFKAPCTGGRCTLITNMDPPDRTVTKDLDGNATDGGSTVSSLAALMSVRRKQEVAMAGGTVHRGRRLADKAKPSWAYYAAVDGDLNSAWAASLTLPSHRGDSFAIAAPYVGLELTRPTFATGVRLVLATGERFSTAFLTPRLEYVFGASGYISGTTSYVQAMGCVSQWSWLISSTGRKHGFNGRKRRQQKVLTYSCPPAQVMGVRLVFQGYSPKSQNRLGAEQVDGRFRGSMGIAELTLNRLPMFASHRGAHVVTDQNEGEHPQAPPPPTSLIANDARIAYVLGRLNIHELQGSTLALLEEACELGAQYLGRVTIFVDGKVGSQRMREGAASALGRLATAFATASGSSCDLRTAIKFVASLNMNLSNHRWDIIFIELGGDGRLPGLWSRGKLHASKVLVARVTDSSARRSIQDLKSTLSNVDAMAVDSKRLLDSIGHPNHYDKDVRIIYPLRTLSRAHSSRKLPVQTPSNPPLEELVLLVTPSTRDSDVELFDLTARHVLQEHGVIIRLSNVTQLVKNALKTQDGQRNVPSPAHKALGRFWNVTPSLLQHKALDSALRRPKWTSVRELARYVAIYPARSLWILDGSASAAYYASVATVEGARFVVSPAGMPHHANRFIAWNATCEWTHLGFEAKAIELVRGRFFWSSSVRDREFLRSDASDVLLDEWHVKRKLEPIAHTVHTIERYVSSLAVKWPHSLDRVNEGTAFNLG